MTDVQNPLDRLQWQVLILNHFKLKNSKVEVSGLRKLHAWSVS